MQVLSSTQSTRCLELLLPLLQANKNHFSAHSQARQRGCATFGFVKQSTSKKKFTVRLLPRALYPLVIYLKSLLMVLEFVE